MTAPSSDPRLASDPQPVPLLAWPALALGIASVALCLALDAGATLTLLAFAACLAASVTLTRHHLVDPSLRTLLREDRVLGRWPISRQSIPFALGSGLRSSITPDADAGYVIRIGIGLRDGRTLWMKRFHAAEPEVAGDALAYARTLRDRTGFDLDPAGS